MQKKHKEATSSMHFYKEDSSLAVDLVSASSHYSNEIRFQFNLYILIIDKFLSTQINNKNLKLAVDCQIYHLLLFVCF